MISDHTELLKIGFVYETEMRDINGKLLSRSGGRNIYPTQALNALLNIGLGSQSQFGGLYVGIFEGNYTPVISDTGATIAGNASEGVSYAETTRPVFTPSVSTAGETDNFASPALFTFNATKTIYGAFITSGLVKAGTTGTLISAARFGTAQTGTAGNVLTVKAGCTLANA